MEIQITEKEFREMYNSCTLDEIEKKLNMSYFKVRKYADQLGLSKKPGRPKSKYLFKVD